MVKYKGISISVISQLDICKLPEYNYDKSKTPLDPFTESTPSTANSFIASCYVPIYSGSQIWFEYTIDGPHPPNAAYFFKLLLNEQIITSWDCTSRSGYHGKMHYVLTYDGDDETSQDLRVRRQAMMFCGGTKQSNPQEDSEQGLIEIRVHRIEHKKRVKNLKEDLERLQKARRAPGGCLELVERGATENRFPCRRYKYQLLDPVDEPFAVFRFYCRSREYLQSIGLINNSSEQSSTRSSIVWQNGRIPRDLGQPLNLSDKQENSEDQHTPVSTPTKPSIKLISVEQLQEHNNPVTPSPRCNKHISCSHSKDSLLSMTRDSIEDLPSSVPRSPKSSGRPTSASTDIATNNTSSTSPTYSFRSPRQRLKNKLTVSLDGVDFDLEKKRRSLSPFTGSGMLRKLVHSVPPSAPAAVTAFGPNINDEIEAQFEKEKQDSNQPEKIVETTTRTERGGNSLMRFLGRRIGSHA